MSSSFTISQTTSFTITHARHMAAKLATDLKRMQRFYGQPSDVKISEFEEEITQLLKNGYLERGTYGYRKSDAWVEPTLRYTARDLAGAIADDDDPGRVQPGADTVGASFYSYVSYSSAWHKLPTDEQILFKSKLPFERSGAPEPAVNGYLRSDRTYSSGGRALDRQSVKGS